MDDVRIRPAVTSDAEALRALAIRTFEATFGAFNRPEDMAAYLADTYGPGLQEREIASPDLRTLLASTDEPIGFVQLRKGPAPPSVTSPSPVEIYRLYVDRPWHGRGVAQALMAAALAEAVAWGARAVWLGVWEHNPRAMAFYRKYGFVDVGSIPFQLGADRQTDRVFVLSALPGRMLGG